MALATFSPWTTRPSPRHKPVYRSPGLAHKSAYAQRWRRRRKNYYLARRGYDVLVSAHGTSYTLARAASADGGERGPARRRRPWRTVIGRPNGGTIIKVNVARGRCGRGAADAGGAGRDEDGACHRRAVRAVTCAACATRLAMSCRAARCWSSWKRQRSEQIMANNGTDAEACDAWWRLARVTDCRTRRA